MALPIPNAFQQFALTAEEELRGRILNSEQQQVLRNRLAAYATEKLFLKFTPSHQMEFLQQEAELQGQIALLQAILEDSDIALQEAMNPSINTSSDF